MSYPGIPPDEVRRLRAKLLAIEAQLQHMLSEISGMLDILRECEELCGSREQ